METMEVFITFLINGFITGAVMMWEVIKQNPWFLVLVLLCMLMPVKKHRSR